MMKKLMLSVLSLATMLTLTHSVYALGSTDVNGTVDKIEGVESGVQLEAKFTGNFEDVDSGTLVEIEELNSNKTELADIKVTNNVPGADLKDLVLLTQVQDLSIYKKGTNEKVDADSVVITWTVENLSKVEGSEVYVLHYNINVKGWELLKPSAVDYVNKKITCAFPNLSPVAVVYKPKAASKPSESTPNTSKPSTGYDDGGPFTTDACGNVFDRWGNEVYHSPVCVNNSVGGNGDYNFVNTSDR